MFKHITIGSNSPKVVNTIVEITSETRNKYEYDEELGIIKLDRVLHSPVHYPFDYGFIPETLCEDGDHLDVMVITNSPTFPGCFVEVRPIGALLMEDEHGGDEKIIAVPLHNPHFKHVKKLKDLAPHLLDEIEHFWCSYKFLEKKNKPVKLSGWVNRLQAYQLIKKSQKTYQVNPASRL
ncbi:inorganic diphosphatase [Candidatus Shapirobacteria bacterium]|nr:inorganic diphosphatase [Candidatus Shapirobacteria bacterium]